MKLNNMAKGILVCLLVLSVIGCKKTGKVEKYLRKQVDTAESWIWADFIAENGINAVDGTDSTLLIEAVKSGNAELVDLCIKAGADVNLYTKSQNPPLLISVKEKDMATMELLLKAGAKVRTGELVLDNYNHIKQKKSAYDILAWLIKKTPAEFANEAAGIILDYYTPEQLDYREIGRLFDNSESNLYKDLWINRASVALLKQLVEKGYKPHVNDVFTYHDIYIRIEDKKAYTDDDKAFLKAWIKEWSSTDAFHNWYHIFDYKRYED